MFLKIRQHRTVRGQETRQECLRGREHCKLIFYHVKETCELCEDWQVWECVPPCGAMKPNLPWDWAWTPQRAFLLVHLILKASCLSGFGSAPGPEGQACVLQTHSDLRRLFEAGQTLFFFFSVTGSPQNSKPTAGRRQRIPGRAKWASWLCDRRSDERMSPTSKQGRDIWQPELLTAPDKPCRNEWGENRGGNTDKDNQTWSAERW